MNTSMNMIIHLAWKNVWRNPVRSGVVMTAIIVGIWSLTFLLSFFQGMVTSYINTAIENKTSHVQIHHPDFKEEQEIGASLENYGIYRETLMKSGIVEACSPRIIVAGLVASATGNRGALIRGVDPELESITTKFDKKIVEGSYLTSEKKNALVMSRGMGKKLGLSLNQHLVISFQDAKGGFVSSRFRVVGWFDTKNVKVDDVMVYVRLADLAPLTSLPDSSFHEMAIKFTDINLLAEGQKKIQAFFPNALVRNYKEISPDLALYTGQVKIALTIVIVIIMIALLFGIINTMLMAVLERQKELGMLMAIGMNRMYVFILIMVESIILSLIAAPVGLSIGYATTTKLSKMGIDLSTWSDALSQFGMESIIYPSLEAHLYWDIVFALVCTAIIGGIYPAIKAINTSPASALRKL